MGDDDIARSSPPILIVTLLQFSPAVLHPLKLFHSTTEIIQRGIPVWMGHGARIVHASSNDGCREVRGITLTRVMGYLFCVKGEDVWGPRDWKAN